MLSVFHVINSYLIFSFSFFCLCSSIYSLLSPVSLLVCCRGLFGCSAKSNSLSYNSSYAISYNSGGAASSVFSSWICGEDCHISEVSWSASSSFLSLSLFSVCLFGFERHLVYSLMHYCVCLMLESSFFSFCFFFNHFIWASSFSPIQL